MWFVLPACESKRSECPVRGGSSKSQRGVRDVVEERVTLKGGQEMPLKLHKLAPFLSRNDGGRLTFEGPDASPGHAEKEDRG